jgi:phasin
MSKNDNNKQTPKFEMPNFEMPKMEVPAAFRELAEKTISQSKENYDRLKQTAEQTTGMLEDAFSIYSKGSLELTSKIIDNAQAQANAVFEYAKSLMESKTVAEALEKQTSFAREQFETLTTQGKEIQELTTKIANDTSAPLKTAANKAAESFKKTA